MAVLSPSMTVAGVLARRGIVTDERDLARALERSIGRYLSTPGSAPLSAQQQSALLAGGLDLASAGDSADDYGTAASRTAADYTALLATALTIPEVAARLGVADSRVRHRILDGELWALKVSARRTLLPLLQFAPDGGLVPGLPAVLGALPDGLHPLEVVGFLTGRRSELRLRGRDQSPVDWLLHGGDVAAVTAAASGVRDRLR